MRQANVWPKTIREDNWQNFGTMHRAGKHKNQDLVGRNESSEISKKSQQLRDWERCVKSRPNPTKLGFEISKTQIITWSPSILITLKMGNATLSQCLLTMNAFSARDRHREAGLNYLHNLPVTKSLYSVEDEMAGAPLGLKTFGRRRLYWQEALKRRVSNPMVVEEGRQKEGKRQFRPTILTALARIRYLGTLQSCSADRRRHLRSLSVGMLRRGTMSHPKTMETTKGLQ